MVAPILTTKLHIPHVSPNLVPRPRLIDRLNQGLHRKLTLISAPAGFGKTTLISEWAESLGCNQPGDLGSPKVCAAWLSLDEYDSVPERFLTYLAAALQTAAPEIGQEIAGSFQSSQQLPMEPILAALLNEISANFSKIILVLDDYHVIDSKSIDDAMVFLIEHQPPNLHVVITTREDPRLHLARLRARNQLTDLRAADLRFSPSDAAEFLQVMDIHLSMEDVAVLEDRTEGWIAGLQLAALAMHSPEIQSSQGHSRFIQAFAGDHRYIMDYLVEEVLQHQPEPMRNFLLQTSILDRLHGPLCAAVTGQVDGSEKLEALLRGNFFVIALDDRRQWYRYHQLFADVLRSHLLAEQPGQIAALHRRASEWYGLRGSPPEAIRHALAGEDFARAADLIERAFPVMSRSRQEAALLGWLKNLPEAFIYNRPVLCNAYAGVLLQHGELQGVEDWLLAAEGWLRQSETSGEQSETSPADLVVVEPEEFRRLPGSVAMHRSGQALLLGDVASALEHARRVLELAPEDDFLRRGAAGALLGLVFWTKGDLETGERRYAEGMAWLERAGNLSDVIGCALALADIRIAQGHLTKAMQTYEWGLQVAKGPGTAVLRGSADMHVGISTLLYEQNDLDAARNHLQRCKELGEHMGLPQNRYRWRAALARIREAEGDLDGALDLLNEAERVYFSDFSPQVRPIPALKARYWLRQGRLGEAMDWARQKGLSAKDELNYLNEFEYITLVRVLLSVHSHDHAGIPPGEQPPILEAAGLLERLLKAAEAGGRTGSVIEILILQALVQQAQDDLSSALAPLEKALILAEPEGYLRIFVDECQPMQRLLREAAACRLVPDYTLKLLAAFGGAQPEEVPEPAPRAFPVSQPLIEPLSQRELEVLRMFKTEMSGPEIADQLVIGLSTVRTHTKSIYGKLSVNSRRAAVKRAEELDLI